MSQTFMLHKGMSRTYLLTRITAFLGALSMERSWRVEVSEHKRTRSHQQNAYLWGCVYETILNAGLREQGWTANDLHEYFLGEHFGWETLEGFGRKRMKPIRRSSKLKTTEFADYIAFIQQRMAEQGVYIPDPREEAA